MRRGRSPSSRCGRPPLKPVEATWLSPYDRQPCFRRAAPIPRTIWRSGRPRPADRRRPDRRRQPGRLDHGGAPPRAARGALCALPRRRRRSACATSFASAASISSTPIRRWRSSTRSPAARGGDDADGVGQDALLQRAGAEHDPARSVGARAVSVSDQGAGAGPARRAARAVGSASRGATSSRSACSPTTATRRRTRGARFAVARTSCSATPTWCTRASCRTIRAGRSCSRTCATSSSTSCTPIAACSAAI